eukprot:701343_1
MDIQQLQQKVEALLIRFGGKDTPKTYHKTRTQLKSVLEAIMASLGYNSASQNELLYLCNNKQLCSLLSHYGLYSMLLWMFEPLLFNPKFRPNFKHDHYLWLSVVATEQDQIFYKHIRDDVPSYLHHRLILCTSLNDDGSLNFDVHGLFVSFYNTYLTRSPNNKVANILQAHSNLLLGYLMVCCAKEISRFLRCDSDQNSFRQRSSAKGNKKLNTVKTALKRGISEDGIKTKGLLLFEGAQSYPKFLETTVSPPLLAYWCGKIHHHTFKLDDAVTHLMKSSSLSENMD